MKTEVLKRAKHYPNTHPNLEDIKQMAQDTIDNVGDFVPDKSLQARQVMDAIRTIIEVEEIKENKK